jgi:hypothetical protein
MKNFVLGVIVGIVIALCGYKPYQIEMEYRHHMATGPNALGHVNCITGVDFIGGVAELKLRQRDGNLISILKESPKTSPKSPY